MLRCSLGYKMFFRYQHLTKKGEDADWTEEEIQLPYYTDKVIFNLFGTLNYRSTIRVSLVGSNCPDLYMTTSHSHWVWTTWGRRVLLGEALSAADFGGAETCNLGRWQHTLQFVSATKKAAKTLLPCPNFAAMYIKDQNAKIFTMKKLLE